MFFVRFSLIAHHLKLGHKLRKKYDKLIQNPDCKEIEASYSNGKKCVGFKCNLQGCEFSSFSISSSNLMIHLHNLNYAWNCILGVVS